MNLRVCRSCQIIWGSYCEENKHILLVVELLKLLYIYDTDKNSPHKYIAN